MSICTVDPEKPWRCYKVGFKEANIPLRFRIFGYRNEPPALNVAIFWEKQINCGDVSNCTIKWMENGETWAYQTLPDAFDLANNQRLIQEAINNLRQQTYDLNRGATFTSISNFTNWVWKSCSNSGGGRSGSSNWGAGSNTNKSCMVPELGSIKFNCKTSDYYYVQEIGRPTIEPDAIDTILSNYDKLDFRPIREGDRFRGIRNLNVPVEFSCQIQNELLRNACIEEHVGFGGTSRFGAFIADGIGNLERYPSLDRIIEIMVKIKLNYFYCE